MNTSLISHVLPEELILYFDLIGILELCDLRNKSVYIEVELEEKNALSSGYDTTACEWKGFLP